MKAILIHIFLAILITYSAYPDGKSKIQPAELVDFSGKYLGDYIELKWVTVSESNTSHFTIQRTEVDYKGNPNYKSIAVVNANMNSNEEEVYFFRDRSIELGKRYNYRLLLEDFDGTIYKFESLIVTVHINPKLKVDFSAKYISNYVEIDWTIEYPENIEYYYIERFELITADGQGKNKILLDSVKAKEPGSNLESYKIYDDSFEFKTRYGYTLLARIKNVDRKYRLAIDELYIDETQPVVDEAIRNFDITSPVNSENIQFKLDLNKESIVNLDIYTTLGNKVIKLNSGHLGRGTSEFYLNRSELSPGTYFYTIQSDDSILSGKFQVIK